MNFLDTLYKIFTMFGGLAIFMYGMKIMGDSLETLAGTKLKKMFAKVSNNRMKSFGIGVGATAVIQSSSATTVMLVGFVNVGFLSLYQATSITMGAAVGTTITAQLASLSSFGSIIDITAIMSILGCIGAFMFMFSKNDYVKHLGLIFLGFGMLFIGLDLMSGSMKTFAFNSDGSPSAFAHFMLAFTNPILCVIAGTLFTAIIQSSSASTGVLIALATAGILNLEPAMYMVLGTHIGTCITAIIASIGTSVNAKRTAMVNLVFNIFGTVIWVIIMLFLATPIANFIFKFSNNNLERAIANYHTISQLVVSLLLLPFNKKIADLVSVLVKDKSKGQGDSPKKLYYLDERIFRTPALAVAQSISEIENMANIARFNLENSIKMLKDHEYDVRTELVKNEEILNYLNIEITNYLIKFSSLDLSKKDKDIIGSLFHVVSDLERIGDYAENMWEYAIKMTKGDQNFSESALEEIASAEKTLFKLYDVTMEAFLKRDLTKLLKVDEYESIMDEDKHLMERMHLERLSKGECTVEAGAIYFSIASQLERVADHMTNIAYSILPYKEKLSLGDIKAN